MPTTSKQIFATVLRKLLLLFKDFQYIRALKKTYKMLLCDIGLADIFRNIYFQIKLFAEDEK
jgi:hypothetical protein